MYNFALSGSVSSYFGIIQLYQPLAFPLERGYLTMQISATKSFAGGKRGAGKGRPIGGYYKKIKSDRSKALKMLTLR